MRKGYLGAYFIVELVGDGLKVECRGIDEPWTAIECSDHGGYGTQFQPEKFDCRLCQFGPAEALREVVWTAYVSRVDDPGEDSIDATDLMSGVLAILDGADGAEVQRRAYLDALLKQPGPNDPLQPSDDNSTTFVPRSR